MTPPVPCLSEALGNFPAIMSSRVTPDVDVVDVVDMVDVVEVVEFITLEEEVTG